MLINKKISLILIFCVFSAGAQNGDVEKITTHGLKDKAQKLGLFKKTTVKEFLSKLKSMYPGYKNPDFEALVKEDPNSLMPEFEIKSVLSSNGESIPVITFMEDGKMQTVQVYGDADKFLKLDNQVFTEKEATDPDSFSKKINSKK